MRQMDDTRSIKMNPRECMDSAAMERELFADRLRTSLLNSDFLTDSPTILAREFNVRYPKLAVTSHAFRKWICGEAIPTQARLQALAQWLHVSAEWLRFDCKGQSIDVTPIQFDSRDIKLLTDLRRLDDAHQEIAREFIRILLRHKQGAR